MSAEEVFSSGIQEAGIPIGQDMLTGGAFPPVGGGSLRISLLSHLQGILELNSHVSHGALQLPVPQQEVDVPDLPGPAVDQGHFCARQRMGALVLRFQPDQGGPTLNDSCVMAVGQVRATADPAGKQGLIRSESRLSYPGGDSIPGMGRELELDGMAGLALDNRRSGLHNAPEGYGTHP